MSEVNRATKVKLISSVVITFSTLVLELIKGLIEGNASAFPSFSY